MAKAGRLYEHERKSGQKLMSVKRKVIHGIGSNDDKKTVMVRQEGSMDMRGKADKR